MMVGLALWGSILVWHVLCWLVGLDVYPAGTAGHNEDGKARVCDELRMNACGGRMWFDPKSCAFI